MMVMAKFETKIRGNFQEIITALDAYILNSAASIQMIDETEYQLTDTHIIVRVYDKYFMRNSSRASLSLTAVAQDDVIYISAIGAGGGQGAIFNFSWGAEEDFVAVVEDGLAHNAFLWEALDT